MHDGRDEAPKNKMRIMLPVLVGLLALSMTFLGGYLTGVHTERQASNIRVEKLSTDILECNKSLEQWCSGSRIRAGACNGEMHMCICANEEDVKNFEF